MSSLDSTSASLFSPASPASDTKIRGKEMRKIRKIRNRNAKDIFDNTAAAAAGAADDDDIEEEEENGDDDSLSFKHGKDNTFDRLCAAPRGKKCNGGKGGRGRVRSGYYKVARNILSLTI